MREHWELKPRYSFAWCGESAIRHWLHIHEAMLLDLPFLARYTIFHFEHFVLSDSSGQPARPVRPRHIRSVPWAGAAAGGRGAGAGRGRGADAARVPRRPVLRRSPAHAPHSARLQPVLDKTLAYSWLPGFQQAAEENADSCRHVFDTYEAQVRHDRAAAAAHSAGQPVRLLAQAPQAHCSVCPVQRRAAVATLPLC